MIISKIMHLYYVAIIIENSSHVWAIFTKRRLYITLMAKRQRSGMQHIVKMYSALLKNF